MSSQGGAVDMSPEQAQKVNLVREVLKVSAVDAYVLLQRHGWDPHEAVSAKLNHQNRRSAPQQPPRENAHPELVVKVSKGHRLTHLGVHRVSVEVDGRLLMGEWQEGDDSPRFGETFRFHKFTRESYIKFTLWHKRTLRQDKRAAESHFLVGNLPKPSASVPLPRFVGWILLEHKDQAAGQLHVDVCWVPSEAERQKIVQERQQAEAAQQKAKLEKEMREEGTRTSGSLQREGGGAKERGERHNKKMVPYPEIPSSGLGGEKEEAGHANGSVLRQMASSSSSASGAGGGTGSKVRPSAAPSGSAAAAAAAAAAPQVPIANLIDLGEDDEGGNVGDQQKEKEKLNGSGGKTQQAVGGFESFDLLDLTPPPQKEGDVQFFGGSHQPLR